MRISQLLLPLVKETPADAELVSHRLMLRAGLIRKLASGVYTWLPLGLKVLRKVEAVVREEMDAIGAQEMLMPSIQPAELWEESERWETYGPLLLKLTDRHERQFCYGPTHEEVITALVRDEINSYKQLPCSLYQIQTKFRDEIRPRFGVMRAREFVMKDAYSFHLTDDSLNETYQAMYGAYSTIFTRLGLNFRAVQADSGDIGGETSQEFQVLADSGEDLIAYSDTSEYAANIERAEAPALAAIETTQATLEQLDTPNCKTISDVVNLLECDIKLTIKTLIVKGEDDALIALILRGDHELNPIKAQNHPLVASPLQMASEEEVKNAMGAGFGSLGPVGCKLKIIADLTAAEMKNMICGANSDNKHYINANWDRDATFEAKADLRNILEGDQSPCGSGHIQFARGIEVGHIFQLGEKYSTPMKAKVLDENGTAQTLKMGCYGIGVSRIVAAAIEQSHDARGIIWPEQLSPFHVALIPLNYHKSERVRQAAQSLYEKLQAMGVTVLLFDKRDRTGALFAQADLIGLPHKIVVGERHLDNEQYEYQARVGGEPEILGLEAVLAKVTCQQD